MQDGDNLMRDRDGVLGHHIKRRTLTTIILTVYYHFEINSR